MAQPEYCTALPPEFYARDPIRVARELLGQILIRRDQKGIRSAKIIETEAYLANHDPASHSHRGITKRNASMFARAGLAYVYTIHAKFCLNAVTEHEGVGSAVLIRAAEPLVGNRRFGEARKTTAERQLLSGPAKLCQAFEIDLSWDGWDLTNSEQLWITPGEKLGEDQIIATPRIGIRLNAEAPLRFCVAGSHYLSRRLPTP